jgi:hypothetical protein
MIFESSMAFEREFQFDMEFSKRFRGFVDNFDPFKWLLLNGILLSIVLNQCLRKNNAELTLN